VLAVIGLIGISKQSTIATEGRGLYDESLVPLARLADIQRDFRAGRFDVVDATMNRGDQSALIGRIRSELA